jgi:hypothetical protein
LIPRTRPSRTAYDRRGRGCLDDAAVGSSDAEGKDARVGRDAEAAVAPLRIAGDERRDVGA